MSLLSCIISDSGGRALLSFCLTTRCHCSPGLSAPAESDVDTGRDGTALNSSYTPAASQSGIGADIPYTSDGIMLEAEGSPSSQQGKLSKQRGHSRHVSWDEGGMTAGYQDSGEQLTDRTL